MFVSRRRRGSDDNLGWKMATLAVAAVLILLGVRLGQDWLIWSAIGVLLLGFVLRFLPGTRKDRPTGEPNRGSGVSGEP